MEYHKTNSDAIIDANNDGDRVVTHQ